MFCVKCGNQMPDGSSFCTKCGTPMTGAMPGASDVTEVLPSDMQGIDYGQRNAVYSQPVQQPYYGAQPQQQPYYTAPSPAVQQPKKGNGGIIAGIIIAIVLVLAIVAVVVFGIIKPFDSNEPVNGEPSVEQPATQDPAPTAPDEPVIEDEDTDDEADVSDVETVDLYLEASNGSTLHSKVTLHDGFVLPDSDTHAYSVSELEDLNEGELCIARNEIFARYGHDFKSSDLEDFLYEHTGCTKVSGRSVSQNELTSAERATLKNIGKLQGSSAYLSLATH